MTARQWCGLAVLVCAMRVATAGATPVYVYVALNGGHQPPFTNGWASAATNIQNAVDGAGTWNIIVVSNGTYYLPKEIMVTNPVGIWSADYFGGLYEPSPTTVIDGNGNRCFVISNVNSALCGLTIQNGCANGYWPTNCGGGVFTFYSGSVYNCAFVGNVATGDNSTAGRSGGAVYLYHGGNIYGSRFFNNAARSDGGAVYADTIDLNSDFGIIGCVFGGNRAGWSEYGAGQADGGAIYCAMGGRVSQCVITGNYATYGGGGVRFDNSGYLGDCVISNNVCGSSGGGVWFQADNMDSIYYDIERCVVVGNRAGSWGGGLYVSGTASSWQGVQVRQCTIADNVAGSAGGGIYCAAVNTLEHLSVANNTAGNGGGAAFVGIGGPAQTGGSISLSIIASNSAIYGGGVYSSQKAFVNACDLNGNIAAESGGGAWLHYSGVVTNSRIFGNSSSNTGGGVACEFGGSVQKCTITCNDAATNGGGALLRFGGEFLGCLLASNTAAGGVGGGVYYETEGTAIACVIQNNLAASSGGGAFIGFNGLARNCLFDGNSAYGPFGGGVYCGNSGVVESCTLYNNVCASRGGGIFVATNFSQVLNTIIYGNHALIETNYAVLPSAHFLYCCADPLPAGEGNIAVAPLFLNIPFAPFSLAANSPCIEAGTNLPWMAGATDLDRNPRIMNPRVDIGAFEFPTAACVRVSVAQINFAPDVPLIPGDTTNIALIFANVGGTTLSGSLTGVQAPFALVSGSPYAVPPGATSAIVLSFAPVAPGGWTNVISLTGGGAASVTMMGYAVPEPLIGAAGLVLLVMRMRSLRSLGSALASLGSNLNK